MITPATTPTCPFAPAASTSSVMCHMLLILTSLAPFALRSSASKTYHHEGDPNH
jgi:hypothetical protein